MRDFINEIIEKFQIDIESIIQFPKGSQRSWLIEGEEKNGIEKKLLVYDCSGGKNKFDYYEYTKNIEEKGEIFQLIMIFDNWDSEWKIMKDAYKKLKNSKDRKDLLYLFDNKISYYIDLSNSLKIEVDEQGENYLEYYNYDNDENIISLKGRVYNISFKELKKIFNVTGKELFRENVRYGLKKNSLGNSLQLKFKEYIKIGAYMKWNEENKDCDDEKIKQVFEIDNDYKIRSPRNFWFYHNGITIYGKDAFDFSGKYVRVNPKNISVINGAQTLTNFFECTKSLPEEFNNICENIIDDEGLKLELKKHMELFILEVKDIMKVKTIFIEGKKEYLQPITCGLNTQIPIKESDILAISDDVKTINKYLLKRNMKIVKDGENLNVEKMFSVVEFIKYYLMIKNKPGESKNLNRKDINKYLVEAKEEFENAKYINQLLEALIKINRIECWWIESKKMRNEMYNKESEKKYSKYGKNYFSSFMLKQDIDFLDDESLIQFYDIFIKTFMEISSSPDLSEFKNDKLFEKYLEEINKNKSKATQLFIDDYDDLKKYLNSNKKSQYTLQKSIREYLTLKNKDISKFIFRVVSRSNNKVNEAFPFPNTTFSDIYQNQNIDEGKIYTEFKNSQFYKDIKKIFPVFIIDWEKKNNEKIIKNIGLIEEFSFKSLEEEAKNVYDKTIEAFKEGDETKFPKMSDKLSFHVRPKAINSDDTFEFTNGIEITKRTFWANKETMNKLIDEMYKNS